MTYPYGLRGAPAVGLGIPGLPIRQSSKAEQAQRSFQVEPYILLHATPSATSSSTHPIVLTFTDFLKDTHDELDLGRPSSSAGGTWTTHRLTLSEDKKLAALLVFSSGTNPGFLALIDTKLRTVVSRIAIPSSVGSLGGVGFNVKSNVLALNIGPSGGPFQIRYYYLDQLLAAHGASISDLSAFKTESVVGAYTYIIEFSPDGQLLALGAGTYSGSSSTNAPPLRSVRVWPSMAVIEQASGAAARNLVDFSKDSNFFLFRDRFSDTLTSAVRQIVRDENGVPTGYGKSYGARTSSNTRLGMQGKDLVFSDSDGMLRVERDAASKASNSVTVDSDHCLYPAPSAEVHAISPDGRWAVGNSGGSYIFTRAAPYSEELDGDVKAMRITRTLPYSTRNGFIQMIGGLVEND